MMNIQLLIGIGVHVFGLGIDFNPHHWTLKCEAVPTVGRTEGWKFLCLSFTKANFA